MIELIGIGVLIVWCTGLSVMVLENWLTVQDLQGDHLAFVGHVNNVHEQMNKDIQRAGRTCCLDGEDE